MVSAKEVNFNNFLMQPSNSAMDQDYLSLAQRVIKKEVPEVLWLKVSKVEY